MSFLTTNRNCLNCHWFLYKRNVCRYHMDNKKPQIEEGQTIPCPNDNKHNDLQNTTQLIVVFVNLLYYSQ